MKFTPIAVLVLAASGRAFGYLGDLFKDVTITKTAIRTVQSCPCIGEERVVDPVPEDEGSHFFGKHPPPGSFRPPFPVIPGKVVTKAEPIVIVYSGPDTATTNTGILVKYGPTRGGHGPEVTKTLLTGPFPTNFWRPGTHTVTTSVRGSAPTASNTEPWNDWYGPPRTISATSQSTSTSSSRFMSTSTGNGDNAGTVGGTISSSSTSSSSFISSTTSTYERSSTGGSPTTLTSSSSTSPSSTLSTFFTRFISTSTSTSSSASSSTILASSTTGSSSSTSGSSTSPTSAFSSSSTTESRTTSSTSESPASSTTLSTSTSSASSTTTSASGAVSTDDVSALSFIDAILEAHNVHRMNHTAANLTWSTDLANTAAKIAATCNYAHDTSTDGGGYGQNIGAGFTRERVPSMIGNSMYNSEMPNYPQPYGDDNPNMSNFEDWGHFSQIVWKATTQVGCANQYCPNGLANTGSGIDPYFTVCNYAPPGNVRGAYSQVGAPLGQQVVIVSPI